MTKTVYLCDRCGMEKKETNHWFLLDSSEISDGSGVNLSRFSEAYLQYCDYEDDGSIVGVKLACGEKCLLEMVSEWASQGHA